MEALGAVALLAVFVPCALCTGLAALYVAGFRDHRNFRSRWERLTLGFSLGLGVVAYLTTLAGLAGVLWPLVAIGLPVVAAVVSLAILIRCHALPAFPVTKSGQTNDADDGQHPNFDTADWANDVRTQSVQIGQAAGPNRTAAATHLSLDGASAPPDSLAPRGERLLRRVTLAALVVVAGATLLRGLAPPTDYDGLLYHLVAPRAFLDAGRIVYLPHNFSANLPAFGEMLFTFGLAAGSDRLPQLIHAAAGVCAVSLTYWLGVQLGGRSTAFWAAAALGATPLVPFLSARAYIDLFTVVFGTVATLAVLRWLDRPAHRWLVLAGLCAGFALATKYSAATLALVLGAAVALASWRRWRSLKSRSIWPVIGPALVFGMAATVTALPWYARQVIELGSPVWPMYQGGRDWDAARVEQLTYFVNQYGSGRRLQDWLLLPFNIYWESWMFGHVPHSYPPFLALAAPLALLCRRRESQIAFALAAVQGVLWARGWQDLRFLLTTYPLFAALGAIGLVAAANWWRDWLSSRQHQSLDGGEAASESHQTMLDSGELAPQTAFHSPARAASARYQAITLALPAVVCASAVFGAARNVMPGANVLGVLTGVESTNAYLARSISTYRAVEFLNQTVPDGGATLFLGDGQIWYCRQRCIPDPAHDNLLMRFVRPGGAEPAAASLRQEGVTHILLSKVDFWYLEHQDPDDRLRQQLAEFYQFKAQFLDLTYEDPLVEVYRARW